MLTTGHVIEKYEVQGVLGSGATAEVYRVRHTQLGSMHALKVLAAVDPERRERLLDEGRVQAGLRHPNLVGVTDVLQVQGRPALVMEYVNGPSLREWMEQGLPDPAQAVELCAGIARGLRHAHERGLIHRDLKPANVLLEVTPQGVVPRVLDFGLVKRAYRGTGPVPSGQGSVGTPAYMAPEQIRDPDAVDERADLFSLGCILYELVHGLPPFAGADPVEVIANLQSGRCRPIDATLPPGLQTLLGRMLAHEPAARIGTAAALVQALQDPEVVRNEQIQAHPLQAMHTLPPDRAATEPRATAAWSLAVAPVLALVLGGGITLASGPGSSLPVVAPPVPEAAFTFEASTPPPPAPAPAVPEPAPPVPTAPAPARPPPTRIPAAAPPPEREAVVPAPLTPSEPAEAAPATGRVVVEGDALGVTLRRGNHRITRLDAVPVGTWQIRADFDGNVVDAGTVEVTEGGTHTLRCVAFALRCRAD